MKAKLHLLASGINLQTVLIIEKRREGWFVAQLWVSTSQDLSSSHRPFVQRSNSTQECMQNTWHPLVIIVWLHLHRPAAIRRRKGGISLPTTTVTLRKRAIVWDHSPSHEKLDRTSILACSYYVCVYHYSALWTKRDYVDEQNSRLGKILCKPSHRILHLIT